MMVGAELFRQGPRAIAMAVAGVTNWVFTFVVAMGFEGVAVSLIPSSFLIYTALVDIFLRVSCSKLRYLGEV